MKPSSHPLAAAGRQLFINFIAVKEPRKRLERPIDVKVCLPSPESLLNPRYRELTRTGVFRHNGIPLSPQQMDDLFEAIIRCASSIAPENDHIFVCIRASGSTGLDGDAEVTLSYNLVTGVHVDGDRAISWDLLESCNNELLQACKPPIPCLKRIEIKPSLGAGQDLCCAICLQELLAGSHSARTACSHVYHSRCIVMWLAKSTFCPLCRSRLRAS